MGSGSDVAMETASLTIVSGDLRRIADAVEISQTMKRTVRQNLFYAFIYNLLAIPIAAGALYPLAGITINPMLGSLLMALSSISVVSNSLRMRRSK
jgi:cation transport ATPase